MSCESLIRASLTRIDAREREVGAWAYVDRDAALARARALDSGAQTGLRSGLLHGLAVGVKDIIDTADMPTEYGSPIYAGNRPRQDAASVRRLDDPAGGLLRHLRLQAHVRPLSGRGDEAARAVARYDRRHRRYRGRH